MAEIANKEMNDLFAKIGTEEATTLKPAKVSIVEVTVEEVGTKGSKKVVCKCKHPDKEEPISISSAKVELKGKLDVVGLWVNKDGEGLLRKGSALVLFLQRVGATSISELKDKEVETLTEEKGYLCFKGY